MRSLLQTDDQRERALLIKQGADNFITLIESLTAPGEDQDTARHLVKSASNIATLAIAAEWEDNIRDQEALDGGEVIPEKRG